MIGWKEEASVRILKSLHYLKKVRLRVLEFFESDPTNSNEK
jgi:hypothetical protein